MERFASLVVKSLNKVLETPILAQELETPPDPKLGDFAFPCFKLAKQFRKSPPQVAAQIVTDLHSKSAVPAEFTVSTAGPYVNFTISNDCVLNALLGEILAAKPYGSLDPQTRGTWVLEYSSPNVAKPLNIYHLRPTALGAVLDRVGRFRGFKMISINHLGDWGKQYGMLAVAFRVFKDELKPEMTMRDLVDLYVRINAMAETAPEIEIEAKQAFVRLEKGDPEITALWQKCVDISMKEFDRNYARLGVKFDHVWGESYYKDHLAPLLQDLRSRNILVESEGAWVVPVTDPEGKELPPAILQKSDGATIYCTRDVAAAIYRQKKFQFDRMTYIVGGEQRLHFQQVFGVLRKMGADWVSRCEHVPTGLYRFRDAKMSTRKGNFVTLDDVLTLAKDRVREVMEERAAKAENPVPLDRTTLPAVTEAVGVGAVVFHDLSTDPARDVEFDIDRVVDFEGETGPYLQYAHTRCLSILRKAHETGQGASQITFNPAVLSQLGRPEEIALIKTLGQFPLHLERTLGFTKASQLAHYLIDVTKVFGSFYRECRVLGEAAEVTQARLMLVEATRRILAQGLGLLGIALPDRM